MTAITEKRHTLEFLLSEGNGTISRELGTLTSGDNLQAGAILQISADKYTEVLAGDEADAVAILAEACDASDGDAPCAVIARNAEVKGDALVYAAGSPAVDTDAVAEALAAVGIIVR